MKKETAISIFAAILLASLSIAGASAQTAVDLNAQVNTGGGLGKGLNSMVRNILGEEDEQQLIAPQASLMMESNASADMSAPAPAARMLKADVSSATMAYSQVTAPMTDDDVSQLISALLIQDDRLQSVDASDTHVRMTYRTEGTVLRFIRVQIPVTAEAYISGQTSLSYPWYVRVPGAGDMRARLDARIGSLINTESITPDNRALLINEMYAFFQTEMKS
jgi:hypothetical protein